MMRNTYRILTGKLQRRYYLRDRGMGGRKTLKWMLENYN
jgi:hypothetical protein